MLTFWYSFIIGEFKESLEKCKKEASCKSLEVATVVFEDGMDYIRQKYCGGSEIEVKSGDLALCDRKVVTATKSIFNQESLRLFKLLFMIFLL